MPCPFRHIPQGGRYTIRVRERIDITWAAWLDGMEIIHEADGTTILTGLVVDQSALHGLLVKIRDMQLTLLSLQLVGPEQTYEFTRE